MLVSLYRYVACYVVVCLICIWLKDGYMYTIVVLLLYDCLCLLYCMSDVFVLVEGRVYVAVVYLRFVCCFHVFGL